MRESGGRAVERSLDLDVRSHDDALGIKPEFSGDEVPEGGTAGFKVIHVDPTGAKKDAGRPAMVAGPPRPLLPVVSQQQLLELRADHLDRGDRQRQDRRQRRRRRQDLLAGRLGPLPAGNRHRRPDRSGDQLRVRRRLVCRGDLDRNARRAGDRARQGDLCRRRSRQAESIAALCRRAAGDGRLRDAADHRDGHRAGRRRDGRHPGRRQLGRRRLRHRDAVPSGRRQGNAHAGARHRREMAGRRSGRQEARRLARHRRQDASRARRCRSRSR